MPQPKSISPGKGREALQLKVQIFRLKYIILFQISQAKFFPNWVLRAKFQRITQILRNSPTQSANSRKIRTVRLTLLYIMFQAPSPAENPAEFQRIMQIPCNSPTQSANHVKFAPFANITRYISDA